MAPSAPFAEVFHAYAPGVWRAMRRLGVREADVEDLCQEVFVVVHRRLPEFEGRSSIKTWIYGICVRVAADYRRRAHVRYEEPTAAPRDERRSAPQIEELARAEARALLDRALDGLAEDKRDVFVLYEIEGLEMKDVAAAVGCPLQTAYSRLYAARRQVHEHITRATAERRS